MGSNQPFRTTASWDQSIDMLDATFPLTSGSHGTAAGYLVQFDHLVVIQADGTATSLRNPSQFLDAGGNPEAPQSILLEHLGIQVEIEPGTRKASATEACPGHRMQLLTTLSI
jgi:malate synthase